jgi:hypothetical protein
MEKYPNTLIPRFYGLHKLKSINKKDGKANEIYFVVMANLFDSPLPIHEQYDLKVKPHHIHTNTNTNTLNTKHLSSVPFFHFLYNHSSTKQNSS